MCGPRRSLVVQLIVSRPSPSDFSPLQLYRHTIDHHLYKTKVVGMNYNKRKLILPQNVPIFQHSERVYQVDFLVCGQPLSFGLTVEFLGNKGIKGTDFARSVPFILCIV